MSETLSVPLQVPERVTSLTGPPDRGTPCTMVILGATGDLTRRKLMPALLHLMGDGLLAEDFSVIGVGRQARAAADFRADMRRAIYEFADPGAARGALWEGFAERLDYVGGDLRDEATFAELGERLAALERAREGAGGPARGRLFHLALPPSAYETALVHLSESGLAPRVDDEASRPWARIVIEKPFGHSLDSARALNAVIRTRFAEHQIYRIDHYLGKETVQNLLVFRFANSMFEPVWNRDHIHHVQITAAESVGVEHRGAYYEESGALRDMFQNHLLQLLALTAMEPPVAFRAEAVRGEKVKALDAVRPLVPGEVGSHAVAGQYGPVGMGGEAVAGYRQERGVAPDSRTPTYAALRLSIDNWRWQGVPFFLRSGKRLPRRVTEVAIRFRRPPHLMFPLAPGEAIAPNELIFRIQPDEGISLGFEVKVPDHNLRVATASMNFTYDGAFGPSSHSAYETLIIDCMVGDATLFTRSDGVEAAWRVVDPVIAELGRPAAGTPPGYAAGTWGPPEADELIARDGARWREP